MKYAKKTYRKRGGRKPTRKPYAKRSSAIAKVVKKVLSRNLERKTWTFSSANQGIKTASAVSAPYVSDLLPQVTQGTGVSQRIGNEIKVTKAYIRGYVNIRQYDATDNPLSLPVLVKMYLVSYKISNQPNFTFASLYSNFFQTNNSSVTWQSNMLDMFLELNKEVWTLHKTKVIKIGASSVSNNQVPVQGGNYFDNSPMTVPFYFEYAKHLDKLKYDDTVNNICTNKNLLLIFQAVNADGSTSIYTPAEVHQQKVVHYTDA